MVIPAQAQPDQEKSDVAAILTELDLIRSQTGYGSITITLKRGQVSEVETRITRKLPITA